MLEGGRERRREGEEGGREEKEGGRRRREGGEGGREEDEKEGRKVRSKDEKMAEGRGMKGERRKYNRIRLSTYWLDVDDHIVLEVHLLNV